MKSSTVKKSLWFLILGWIYMQLEIFLSIPEKLGEHAIIGWIDEQIGRQFGITSPTLDQVVAWTVRWGPPALLAVVSLSGWIAFWRLRAGGQGSYEISEQDEKPPKVQQAADAPSEDRKLGNEREQTERLKGRINALVRTGSDLLSMYSFMRGHFDDRPKFIGWLTEARQLSGSIRGEWNAYASQLDQTIGSDPSNGDVYEKTQIAHAILERLLAALGE